MLKNLKRSDVYFGVFVVLALIVLYMTHISSSKPVTPLDNQINYLDKLDSLHSVIEKDTRKKIDSNNLIINKKIRNLDIKQASIEERINGRRPAGPRQRF